MMIKKQTPGPGQESVWDYPRPPALESCPNSRIRIVADDLTIVDTKQAWRVLETSHPPVYYIPVGEVRNVTIRETFERSWCEWKGEAHYFSLILPQRTIECAGWFYPDPNPRFAELKRTLAFYPSKLDACYVDDELVSPQAGDFYGGWITPKVVGPFKGGPGTMGW